MPEEARLDRNICVDVTGPEAAERERFTLWLDEAFGSVMDRVVNRPIGYGTLEELVAQLAGTFHAWLGQSVPPGSRQRGWILRFNLELATDLQVLARINVITGEYVMHPTD